jgi:DNA-directed RNA polymerase sigma subunit (sigma70/sigma32)
LVVDDEDFEELAKLYGVTPEEVEALYETLGDDVAFDDMTQDELTEYIDSLYDALVDAGWGESLDVSDLWDMYYGYTPGVR